MDIADVIQNVTSVIQGGTPVETTDEILGLEFSDLVKRLGISLHKTDPFGSDPELISGIVIGFCAAIKYKEQDV